MSMFPPLTPSSRSFTPGSYSQSVALSLSGDQSRIRNSSKTSGATLDLVFLRLTEVERLAIEYHYLGQFGIFEPFHLPAQIFSGIDQYSYQQCTTLWRYAEPPEIEDFCGPYHDVRVRLVAVQGGAPGAGMLVAVSLSAGIAYAFPNLGVTTYSIATGISSSLGAVSYSLAAGHGSVIAPSNRISGLHLDGNLTDTTGLNTPSGTNILWITSGQKFGSGALSFITNPDYGIHGNVILNQEIYYDYDLDDWVGTGFNYPAGKRIKSNDFVFRAWVKFPSGVTSLYAQASIFYGYSDVEDSSGESFDFGVNRFGEIIFSAQSGGVSVYPTNIGTLVAGQFAYVECGRINGYVRGSVNGVVSAASVYMDPSRAWGEHNLYINQANTYMPPMIMDDSELLTGEGPRVTNFTPPTGPFS